MRLVSAAVLVLLGCSEGPASTVAPPTVLASSAPPAAVTALANQPRLTAKMPSPTRMPDGGIRIDMRGTVRHVHTLERQPDGKYRQACVGAPASPASQGTK